MQRPRNTNFATRNENLRIRFERRYGLNPEEFSLDGEENPPDEGGSKYDAFAENEPDHPELLDQLVEVVLPEAVRRNQAFVDNLPGLLNKAESFHDIQLLLAEHPGQDLDMQAQEELPADLVAAAELMGRAAVRDEG